MAEIVVEGSVGLEVRGFVRVHGNCFIGSFYYNNSEIMSKISYFQFHN